MKKILLLLSVLMFVLVGCSAEADPAVEITLDLTEFAYSPGSLELKVGQVVTLIINNGGNLEHEIMFGRDVVMVDGKANGYETDLFEFAGVSPEGMMDMTGDDDEGEHEMEGMDMEGMDMEDEEMHSGFMTTIDKSGGTTTIVFTVTEEMVGEWEFGCFLDKGTHYAAGMTGTLSITN